MLSLTRPLASRLASISSRSLLISRVPPIDLPITITMTASSSSSFSSSSSSSSTTTTASTYLTSFSSKRTLLEEPELTPPKVAKKPRSSHVHMRGTASHVGSAYAQVLATGAPESEAPCACLYLFTDSHRYLINVGEGIQKLAIEHGVAVGSATTVLISRLSWRNLGGFPNILLTWDLDRDINLMGPANILDWIMSTRYFLQGSSLHLSVSGVLSPAHAKAMVIDHRPVGGLRVEPVVVRGNQLPDDASYRTMGSDRLTPVSITLDYDCRDNRQLPAPEDTTLCYIIRTPDVLGKFQAAKAQALGLRPGPNYRILQDGGCLTLEDGTVVAPEQVMDPTVRGPTLLFLDLPTRQHFENCRSDPQIQLAARDLSIAHIYHHVPVAVFESPQYLGWLATAFGPDTKHVLMNERAHSTPCLGAWAGTLQHLLHRLDPSVFPMLRTTDPPALQSQQLISTSHQLQLFLATHFQRGYLLPLRRQGLAPVTPETSSLLHTRPFTVSAPVLDAFLAYDEKLPAMISELQTIRRRMTAAASSSSGNPSIPPEEDVKIVFLGTASACPTKFRNISSILLKFPHQGGAVLWDCAESTRGQLFRSLGGEEALRLIAGLTAVCITHMHADHHLGLVEILRTRTELGAPPLLIYGPLKLRLWLREHHKVSLDRASYILHPTSHLQEDSVLLFPKSSDSYSLSSVPVRHVADSWAFVLTTPFGDIVYSGDTMEPCPSLWTAGKNAALLIHEATFEDDMAKDARAKAHSTIGQAITSGVQMNATATILLTHFSARYAGIPPFEHPEIHRAMVALDYMTVSIRHDLPFLPFLLPAVRRLTSWLDGAPDPAKLSISHWLQQQFALQEQLDSERSQKCST